MRIGFASSCASCQFDSPWVHECGQLARECADAICRHGWAAILFMLTMANEQAASEGQPVESIFVMVLIVLEVQPVAKLDLPGHDFPTLVCSVVDAVGRPPAISVAGGHGSHPSDCDDHATREPNCSRSVAPLATA